MESRTDIDGGGALARDDKKGMRRKSDTIAKTTEQRRT